MSLLRPIYRRPCVDHDRLRNPVDRWLAGGSKFHRRARQEIWGRPSCCHAGTPASRPK